MFGIESSELAIVALVALLVIGPKDLPRVMRQVGNWIAKGRAMSRHVRAGFDTMMREAELEEMQKTWAAQNEAIMQATALPNPVANSMAGIDPGTWALPDPLSAEAEVAAQPASETVIEAVAEVPLKKPRPPRKKKLPESQASPQP